MKTYKTIRLSQQTYEVLLAYRAELETINRQNISFDEAVDMAFGEMAGLEYEIGDHKARLTLAGEACTCGAADKFALKQ